MIGALPDSLLGCGLIQRAIRRCQVPFGCGVAGEIAIAPFDFEIAVSQVPFGCGVAGEIAIAPFDFEIAVSQVPFGCGVTGKEYSKASCVFASLCFQFFSG